MSAGIRMLIAGNWKMNGVSASLPELRTIAKSLEQETKQKNLEALICLPFTLLTRGVDVAKGSALAIGAQDCYFADSGAHTGDVSAPMLKDAGASFVIVGHSERRADHHENDALIRKKAEAAWRAGLTVILCVGETLAERENGTAQEVVGRQCDGSIPDGATAEHLVIAYEPVWAIGTGKIPTIDDIAEMHGFIREKMQQRFGEQGDRFRVLYGGSVKPGNAAEILSIANVNGALIGGASLKAVDFLEIIRAAAAL